MFADDQSRFKNWLKYIRENVGNIDETTALYFWHLYDTLMTQIQDNNLELIKYKQKLQSNGKTH